MRKEILTSNESWVHYNTTESKHSSMQWCVPTEDCHVSWFFFESLRVFIDFLHRQCIINVVYYCEFLTTVKAAYVLKRRNIPIRNVLLPEYETLHHCIYSTNFRESSLRNLEYPPHGPNLSPRGYQLFGPLREAVGREEFEKDIHAKLAAYQTSHFLQHWT